MNAVIYARYSPGGRQTEQSIEGQLRDCYTFAEREGLKVVGEYIDRAISGTIDDRPDFQRMITDSKKKQFQRIIVWKLDRFARNRYDSAIYKHKLKQNNVRVLSAMENIGEGDESVILEAILEASAEYYSLDLSKKVKRGLRESVLKGSYTGGRPPIGYKIVDKKLVIDENKAPIIRYAFEQYASGVSKKKIIEELNAKGIRNSAGNPLTPASFQTALKNKKYIGIFMYGGEEVVGGCPAMIDESLFNKVQEKLAETKHSPAARKAYAEYLLQGKAYCGHCGARMVGESGKGKLGKKYYYYACSDKKKLHTCDKKNEKKDFLEWYVVEQTLLYVLTETRMEMIAKNVVAAYEKEFNNSKVKQLEKRVAKLERDINSAIDTILETSSQLVKDRMTVKAEELEAQKSDLEIDLSKLRIANGIRYTEKDIISWLKQFCNGDIMDESFRRRIIDVFINSVYIYDDRIVIFYNIRGGKQVSYIEMQEATEDAENENGGAISDTGVRISNASLHQTFRIV